MNTDLLRQVPLFSDLPDEDIDSLGAMLVPVELSPHEGLFDEGDTGDRAYVIAVGEIEITKQAGGREVLLAVRRAGEVIGEMSLLEEAPRMASARARGAATLYALEQQQLDALVRTSASAARTLFYTVLARWRSTGVMLRQSEKMAQLGTMTAGVAHELNNPAAAVQRGTSQLTDAMRLRDAAGDDLAALNLNADEREFVKRESARAREKASSLEELDATERADREDEIEEWLDEHGVPEAWEHASALVDLGLRTDDLATLAEALPTAALPSVVRWLGTSLGVQTLVAEIGQGARRISKIVDALKQYSFLDQGPVQQIDVHEGIENTLTLLEGRFGSGIQIKRAFADDLPGIQADGSALNQVWTQLIDNACHALGESGQITICTSHDHGRVQVVIEDDGPGIPDEIQDQVFDAFFTTKAPGDGTGQGLNLAQRIVVDHHRGALSMTSRPGQTRFRVSLPVSADAASRPSVESADDETERRVLSRQRTIAVVEVSDNPDLPAHDVPRFLQSEGLQILPVHSRLETALGVPVLADLSRAQDVDTVLVFQTDNVAAIVETSIEIGASAVWMQDGVIHEGAALRAREAGLDVIMDRCIRTSIIRHRADDARAASIPPA